MGSYLYGIWRCRYFWLSLVKMDLRTRYRGSMLGLGWSLLQPLAMTIILCSVFAQAFKIDAGNYAPYLLVGLATWNYILTVTLEGCACFHQAQCYIRQHPAPLAIYPLRTVLSNACHFLLALFVVLLMLVFLHFTYGTKVPHPGMLLAIVPGIVLLVVFCWSLSLLAGLAHVYFPDTRHLLEVSFHILFYMTPIMYYPILLRNGNLKFLEHYNPIVFFLNLFRQPLLDGQIPDLWTIGGAGLTVAVFGLLAAWSLKRLEKRFIFHL
jgi:ABC-type polysaccharide/polyol phosphate export permease